MTSAPADLLACRTQLLQVTGLSGNALGVAPDPEHLSSGGYHVGPVDIRRIGRWDRDYSTRQARDRGVAGNSASAVDIGDAWRTGRVAWLRFNNLLYAEMRDHPGNLPDLRAINVSLDGRKRQRYDQLYRGDGLIASTDTVDTHTHLEFWRDTEGRRSPTLARIVELARAAVTNTTPAKTGEDMTDTTPADVNSWKGLRRVEAISKNLPATVADPGMPAEVNGLASALAGIASQASSNGSGISQILTATQAGGWSQEQRDALAEDLAGRVFDKLSTKLGDALIGALTDPRAIEAYRQGANAAEDS